MTPISIAIFLILTAFLAANLPWLSERFLGFIHLPRKDGWMRWLEWLLLYGLNGLLAVGLEYKVTGENHAQDWEFYVITLCLFMVFALPGFIFHYDLKKILQDAKSAQHASD